MKNIVQYEEDPNDQEETGQADFSEPSQGRFSFSSSAHPELIEIPGKRG